MWQRRDGSDTVEQVCVVQFSPSLKGGDMLLKRIGWYSVLAVVLLCSPLLVMAQVQIQIPLPPGWPQFREEPPSAPPEHYGDEPRGLLEVINDWEDQVSITVWT